MAIKRWIFFSFYQKMAFGYVVTLRYVSLRFVLLLYFYYNNIDESDFLSQLWISVVPSKHIIFLTSIIFFLTNHQILFFWKISNQARFNVIPLSQQMTSCKMGKKDEIRWCNYQYLYEMNSLFLQICLFQWNKQNCWFNLLLKIISQGRNSQRFLRQIHMIFVTLGLTILIFFKTESSFWSRYPKMLTTWKITNYLYLYQKGAKKVSRIIWMAPN